MREKRESGQKKNIVLSNSSGKGGREKHSFPAKKVEQKREKREGRRSCLSAEKKESASGGGKGEKRSQPSPGKSPLPLQTEEEKGRGAIYL